MGKKVPSRAPREKAGTENATPRKAGGKKPARAQEEPVGAAGGSAQEGGRKAGRPSSLLDTRVIYCGDCLEKLADLPDHCVDLVYIDPPFNSNRNYEVFWGETKEKRAFEDRHASTQAYIDSMRPRCVQLARVPLGPVEVCE